MARVLIGLSGGVDSSVAALILKQSGYELIGINLQVFNNDNLRFPTILQSKRDAIILAEKLKIPLYFINVEKKFKDQIINYFVKSYINGITPNPCVFCNHLIKWEMLIKMADELNCEYVATGHYANIRNQNNSYHISLPKDMHKDQSYFLWQLSQKQLKRTLFPLGNLSKTEVLQFASSNGLKRLSKKQESYNICFIPDGDYRSFVHSMLNLPGSGFGKGYFYTKEGKNIGEFHGIWNYTVGQKVKIENCPEVQFFVLEIKAKEKKIILGDRNQLYSSIAILEPYQLTENLQLIENIEIMAKYAYKSPFESCKIKQTGSKLIVHFINPVCALAPGQSVVLYKGEDLIGGGLIKSTK